MIVHEASVELSGNVPVGFQACVPLADCFRVGGRPCVQSYVPDPPFDII
jgi:hypothetical protein